MKIYENIENLIGRTPLLRAKRYAKASGTEADILVKLECFNPAGSIKDRVALAMIDDAEKRGLLKKGTTIIEPTSGNTGIGLAAVGVSRGYRVILTMPDTMSVERRKLLKAYGAEIVLTDGKLGMTGAILRAEEMSKDIPDSIILGQFTNPANPAAHYKNTGPEIWEATGGKLDIFVAGIGTGGTVSGAGRYLKERNPAIAVVGVEPLSSPVLTKGVSGAHRLMGIGAGFVPQTLDLSVLDEVVAVRETDAYSEGRLFSKSEGVLVGISSGAALAAAKTVASREENRGKTVVVILPDGGDRYLSTEMYGD